MSTTEKISHRSTVVRDVRKVEVCCGDKCTNRGSCDIFDTVRKKFKDSSTTVEMTNCFGDCRKGPNVLVDEECILRYTKPNTVVERIRTGDGEPYARYYEDSLKLEDEFLGDL